MDLRRFLRQVFLLLLPFVLILGAVAIVDPYSMFGSELIVNNGLKRRNLDHSGRTMSFSNVMWKMLEFKRDPQPNVIIGDSRLSYFDLDHLRKVAGEDHYNFGVPGGNHRTTFDLFQYADSVGDLRKVYLQVSFRTMRPDMNWDIVQEPSVLTDRPLLYLTNRRVIEAAALNLYSLAKGDGMKYDELPPDQWDRVIAMEKENIDGFAMDDRIFDRIGRIAEHCKEKGIELVLLEYPMHPDLQAMYRDAGLLDLRERYVKRMRSIAPYIDLDVPGLFPADRALWRDPLHLTPELQRMLIDHAWGQRSAVPINGKAR